MSAIAEFRIIQTSKLIELREKAEIKIEKKLFGKKVIDNYWDYLEANSKKLKDFDWSGYIFADLFIFLEEKKGIDLLTGKYDSITDEVVEKRGNAAFIFTLEHKQKYLSHLASDNFTESELIEFNKEFSENSDPELAKAELEALKLLKENLDFLMDEDHVILLNMA